MYKVEYTITNSVNDNEINGVEVFESYEEALAFENEKEHEVKNWNKEASDWRSGINSTRYIDISVENITKETTIPSNIKLGDLSKMINYINSI